MKKDIHPSYVKAPVRCACGNEFETGSTIDTIKVEICSKCHPFFTGTLKYIDTAGRIEKFTSKIAESGYASLKRGKKTEAKAGDES